MLGDDDNHDWDKMLDTVLMGYRASKQASINQSPYYVLFPRQMRQSIDIDILPQLESAEDNLDEVVHVFTESREKALRKAQENISKAQERRQKT